MADTCDILVIAQRRISEMSKRLDQFAQYSDAKDCARAGIEWGKLTSSANALGDLECLMADAIAAKAAKEKP